jgi:septal ring factor EnvC (AmiA/AmiB activator)
MLWLRVCVCVCVCMCQTQRADAAHHHEMEALRQQLLHLGDMQATMTGELAEAAAEADRLREDAEQARRLAAEEHLAVNQLQVLSSPCNTSTMHRKSHCSCRNRR